MTQWQAKAAPRKLVRRRGEIESGGRARCRDRAETGLHQNVIHRYWTGRTLRNPTCWRA